MNEGCDAIRLLIGGSIGRPLGREEEENLERHLASCPSCRAYREALLADDSLLDELASCHADSLRRVETKAARARPAAVGASSGLATAGRLSRVPRWASLAAATVIVVFVAVGFFRSAPFGPAPAFASVLEKARQAQSVSFRMHRWVLGQWKTEDRFYNGAGVSRLDYGDSILVISRRGHIGMLWLYPAEKRTVMWRSGSPSPVPEINFVEKLAGLNERSGFMFVRRERQGDKNVGVYERTYRDVYEKTKAAKVGKRRPSERHLASKAVVWVDLDTMLPMRYEDSYSYFEYTAESGPYGLRLKDFMPDRELDANAIGWNDLHEGNACIIWDDFKWNMPIDSSLFSLNPPVGYAVQHIADADSMLSGMSMPHVPYAIRQGLAEWAALSKHAFPESLGAMGDAERIRPRLIAAYNRDGVPGDEYRQAVRAALSLENAAKLAKAGYATSVNYTGKGCVFGDPRKPVCWVQLKDESGTSYWTIYADLHVRRSDAPPRN